MRYELKKVILEIAGWILVQVCIIILIISQWSDHGRGTSGIFWLDPCNGTYGNPIVLPNNVLWNCVFFCPFDIRSMLCWYDNSVTAVLWGASTIGIFSLKKLPLMWRWGKRTVAHFCVFVLYSSFLAVVCSKIYTIIFLLRKYDHPNLSYPRLLVTSPVLQ